MKNNAAAVNYFIYGILAGTIVIIGLTINNQARLKKNNDKMNELEVQQVTDFYIESNNVKLLRVIDTSKHVACYTRQDAGSHASLSCIKL